MSAFSHLTSDSGDENRDSQMGEVWIVDDSPLEAEMAQHALGHYRTQIFTDGSILLEALSAGATPDALVLDWQMPGVSGIEVCGFLREQPRTVELPILLLTGNQATDDIVRGLAAGANDYVTKPFSARELMARVDALVRSRRLRERAERAEGDLRRVLEELPDALLVVGPKDRIGFANQTAKEVFGDALVGQPVSSVLGAFDAAAELGDVQVGERTFAPAVRRIQLGNDPASVLVTLRDVTEKRRTEARRLDFYSIIAHDLRSPLAAMQLRTGLMLSGSHGEMSPKLAVDIQKLSQRIEEMTSLINDFLDLARIEGVGLVLESEPVDIVEVARATVEDLLVSAEARSITVRLHFPSEPIWVVADRRRLGQIFSNLMSNAVKFARSEIVVSLSSHALGVEGAVSDDGRGISPERAAGLFQRYRRGESEQSGTGLGLMIIREIVEGHGGTVGVESIVDQGSRFWFRLPPGTST